LLWVQIDVLLNWFNSGNREMSSGRRSGLWAAMALVDFCFSQATWDLKYGSCGSVVLGIKEVTEFFFF
jgi:hypothetical protein